MTNKFKYLFISYGRRESLGFVGRLHQRLKLAGYDGWFDKVNIPDGDDYAERISHGIESAHNFVYVMAPRCMTSPYCLLELEYARLLGKRLIPINQMVIYETPPQELSEGDKQVMVSFYKHYNQPDQNIRTTQEVLARSHALIGRTDWLDAKQKVSDDDCQRLVEWAQPYENNWAKHDDLDYLKSFEFPVFGETIDALDGVVERITAVIERQTDYVHHHTEILTDALHWQKNQKATQHLLVGKERTAAEEWLLTEFLPPKQPPSQPSTLVCEFICEARKNAENRMTDVFICYDIHDKPIRDSVIQSLSRYAKTTWTHDRDIEKGATFGRVIEIGIENADNFFFFLSPLSITSEYCKKELAHAQKYSKRIVPLLIAPTPVSETPEVLRELQYVDFTDNTCQADYDSDIDDILNILRLDHEYYEQHKMLLARALKWESEKRKSSFLLRGHNLENAKTWLRLNDKREQHPPLALHKEFITASEAAKGQLGTEVFVSYSRKDADFARQLNTALQEAGKTTWFDQESISTGVDFENEIFKGINSADNFLFVLSADAIDSEYCEREVNYASEQSKRFISVLYREVDPTMLPEALRVINWIDFKDVAFDRSFPELIQAIELDREHAHQHTVLQQRAGDWVENNRSSDFLLNITACDNAEGWQDRALEEEKKPVPTVLQQDFIVDSRKAIKKANRRRNILFSFVGLLAIVAVVLAGFAFVKMEEAEEAKQEATIERDNAKEQTNAALETQSLFLSDLSRQQTEKENIVKGILLALEGLPKNSSDKRPYVAKAERRLYQAIFNDQELNDQRVRVLERFVMEGEHAAFSPDGKTIVTAGAEGAVHLWNASNGQLLHTLTGHTYAVTHAAFSPNGQRVITSSSLDNTARLWNADSGQLLHTLTGHTYWLNHAAFSPDGQRVITASRDKTARLWNADTGQLLHILTGHTSYVNHAAFNPDGQRVTTASRDKTARLWIADSGQLLHTLTGHTNTVNAAFSPDGQRVITSGDKTARMWNADTGQLLHTLTGHTSSVYHAAFSPDGQRVITSGDKTARLWIADSGQLLHTLTGHTSSVYHAAFSPDGQRVITSSSDKTARLWIADSGQLLHTLKGHTDDVTHAAFSPDGQRVITSSSDKTARLWVADSGQLLHTLAGHHTNTVRHAAFSPDGQRVITLGDKTARLWDADSGQLLHTLTGHTSSMSHAAFSPDGQRVITSSLDKTARLWKVFTTTQALIDHAYKTVSRCLTPEERKQFFLPPEPSWELIEKGTKLAQAGDIPAATDKFKQAKQDAPCFKFNSSDKARRIAAQAQIEIGKTPLKDDKIEEAIAAFKRATEIDSRFNGLPLVTNIWLDKGNQLAKKGQIEGAVAEFKKAKALVPSFLFEPEIKAKQLFAPVLVQQGEKLTKKGEIEEAIAKYQEAQQMDSHLDISAYFWNKLCWNGSLYGYAAKVMDACEKAVALEPEDKDYRRSLGLARALTDNIQRAIEDFQFYVERNTQEWQKKNKQQVQNWLDALQKGENPFTPEVLKGLRLIVTDFGETFYRGRGGIRRFQDGSHE